MLISLKTVFAWCSSKGEFPTRFAVHQQMTEPSTARRSWYRNEIRVFTTAGQNEKTEIQNRES